LDKSLCFEKSKQTVQPGRAEKDRSRLTLEALSPNLMVAFFVFMLYEALIYLQIALTAVFAMAENVGR